MESNASIAAGGEMFVELQREANPSSATDERDIGKKVTGISGVAPGRWKDTTGSALLYIRRKNVPPHQDGGTVFFVMAHHSVADAPDSLFTRNAAHAASLKALAVNADTFHHTGKLITGFCSVRQGVARVRVTHIEANTMYRIAAIFKLTGRGDSRAALEDPAPILETVQLRELKEKPQSRIVAVVQLRGPPPWNLNLIPSLNTLQVVAQLYFYFLRRITHLRRGDLSTPLIIRGVSDPLCSQYISLCMLCGDIFQRAGGVRTGDIAPSKLFDALSDLGRTPETKSSQAGPLRVDWFDFLLLSSLPGNVLPRLHQILQQYRAPQVEGASPTMRFRLMLSPELQEIPAGSLLPLYFDQQRTAPGFNSLVLGTSSSR
jgi:hypothetical protein